MVVMSSIEMSWWSSHQDVTCVSMPTIAWAANAGGRSRKTPAVDAGGEVLLDVGDEDLMDLAQELIELRAVAEEDLEDLAVGGGEAKEGRAADAGALRGRRLTVALAASIASLAASAVSRTRSAKSASFVGKYR